VSGVVWTAGLGLGAIGTCVACWDFSELQLCGSNTGYFRSHTDNTGGVEASPFPSRSQTTPSRTPPLSGFATVDSKFMSIMRRARMDSSGDNGVYTGSGL
jgi:hypothetical protein